MKKVCSSDSLSMTTKNATEESEDATKLLNEPDVLDTFDFEFNDEDCEQDVGQRWPDSWDVESSQPLFMTEENHKFKPASISVPQSSAIEGRTHALSKDDRTHRYCNVEVESKLACQEANSSIQPNGIQPNDVLFGRSSQARRHIGNKYFRDLVRSHEEQYRCAIKRDDKGLIIKSIVSTIHDRGGRFLKRATRNDNSSEAWTVVNSADAHDKVSHTLRNLRLWGNQQSHNSPPNSPASNVKPAAEISSGNAAKPHLNFEASLLGIVGRQSKGTKLSRRRSFPHQAGKEQTVKPKSEPSSSYSNSS